MIQLLLEVGAKDLFLVLEDHKNLIRGHHRTMDPGIRRSVQDLEIKEVQHQKVDHQAGMDHPKILKETISDRFISVSPEPISLKLI